MSSRAQAYNPSMSASELLGFASEGSRIEGDVRVPASKSLAQRALVLASLAHGRTRIASLPAGDDVQAALKLVTAAGARVERLAPAAVAIEGVPPAPHRGWCPETALDAGESGTLARFATAALGLCGRGGRTFRLEVAGTLARRSSAALFAALSDAGVRFERSSGASSAGWPVDVRPIGPPSTLEIADVRSSQEVSALLIALAAYPDEIELVVRGAIPSAPYLAMTLSSIARFGARVERLENEREVAGIDADATDADESNASVRDSIGHDSSKHSARARDERSAHDASRGQFEAIDARVTFRVRGPLTAPIDPLTIEPDASSGAVALAAGCLSGGVARVRGLGAQSSQGDVRIVEHLRAFGCEASSDADGLVARGAPTRSAHLDLSGEPDLAPVLAIVAAVASEASGEACTLSGLETLQGKESQRIDVLAHALREAGFVVEHDARSLTLRGRTSTVSRPIVLDPLGDHRMAFAFALLGLVVGNVLVREPQCVAKSWPSFWKDLERAGARVVVSG